MIVTTEVLVNAQKGSNTRFLLALPTFAVHSLTLDHIFRDEVNHSTGIAVRMNGGDLRRVAVQSFHQRLQPLAKRISAAEVSVSLCYFKSALCGADTVYSQRGARFGDWVDYYEHGVGGLPGMISTAVDLPL